MGVLVASFTMFAPAEMGDKTKFTSTALGASYMNFTMVLLGTTLGISVVGVPAVLLGDRLVQAIQLAKMRFIAAAMFAIVGELVLPRASIGFMPD